MGKKSDERARRKALAQEKFESSKAAFISKVAANDRPRQAIDLPVDRLPRLAPHLERAAANAEKAPKFIDSGSRFSSLVTWCTTRADIQDSWSWQEQRAWSQEEWKNLIEPPFKDFERLTWQEIDQFSSDGGHKMHHGHELGDLIPEAQERWRYLELEQFDSVFRFRLSGQKRRAWGFIVQAHFHFVWWDREHSIYPTEHA